MIEDSVTLVQENAMLRKALELYERERIRYRHTHPDITGEFFIVGYGGEIGTLKLPEYVDICPAYGSDITVVYKRTEIVR